MVVGAPDAVVAEIGKPGPQIKPLDGLGAGVLGVPEGLPAPPPEPGGALGVVLPPPDVFAPPFPLVGVMMGKLSGPKLVTESTLIVGCNAISPSKVTSLTKPAVKKRSGAATVTVPFTSVSPSIEKAGEIPVL